MNATDPAKFIAGNREKRGRHSRLRLVAMLLAALAMVLVVAACGSDDDDSAATEPAASAPSTTPAAAPDGAGKKAAMVLTFKKDVGNFDPSGYAGFQKMVEEHGFESEVAEEVFYDTAPAVLADLGRRGFDLVIAHSQGYQEAVLKVAPDFPDTFFVIYPDATETGDLPNVASWVPDPYQAHYLTGALSALMTKSDHLGIVGSIPLPAIRAEVAGFEDGAKQVNPDIKFTTNWINSFTDVAKAKEAALGLYQGGADIVVNMADTAGRGIFQAAKEQKKFAIGNYADEGKTAPDVVLASGSFNFAKHYDEIGDAFAAGTIEPKLYKSGLCEDGLVLLGVRNVPEDVQAKVDQLKADICSGKVKLEPRLAPNP